MSIRFPRTAALALGLALIAAAGQPALAADGDSQQTQQSQQQAAAPDFSQQKLDAFASAAVKVSEVRRAWAPKIRKAQQGGNKQKAQQLAQQATGEMRTTIEQADNISIKEYQQIAQAAQQDQELAKELSGIVQKKMQKKRGGQGQTQSGIGPQ
jgi:UDP-2,3-diacylglucosamine pyrophosphatase LpxH